MKNGIIVEFMGLPGAGKSLLVAGLAAELGALGVDARTRSYGSGRRGGRLRRAGAKMGSVVFGLLVAPRSTVRCLVAIVRSGQQNPFDVVRLWVNWAALAAAIRRARSLGTLTILDQGVFQLLWSVCLSGRPGCLIKVAGPVLHPLLPDLLVVVDSSPATAMHRAALRPRSPGRLDPSSLTASGRWQQGARAQREVLDYLGGSIPGGGRVVTVDNDEGSDPAITIEALAREVEALISERRR